MAAVKPAKVSRSYSFAQPPKPSVHEIFKTSDLEDPSGITAESNDHEIVRAKKPKWLVRGDLSDATAVEDMVNLSELSEESILLNLRIRYKANLIYTYMGSVLVSVNPYRPLPIYTDKHVKQYDGIVLGPAQPPHLFAIGSETFSRLIQDSQDQCIIVSGETGAGKTESVKRLLVYLAKVNASKESVVTEQLLKATPLLESFGNAKTIKNNNSSRFGKYMEIVYDSGRILGGKLSQYLLEKSRIVHQHYGERNFHVFYELLSGISMELRLKLKLGKPEDYHYLNKVSDWQIEGKSDVNDFKRILNCFDVLRFTEDERHCVYEVLAVVLQLGNIEYNSDTQQAREAAVIASMSLLNTISDNLHLDSQKLVPLLTSRYMMIRGEKVAVPLTYTQALSARDALARALYSQLFTWLVHRVNKAINPTLHHHGSIALLDIFGFENFRENSFEQLCINYANEQLQHLFNQTIFENEQRLYRKEEIKWDVQQFTNNEQIVDLFSLRPLGILRVLDDESQFPKGTDQSFLEKLHRAHKDNDLYTKPRTDKLEFTVKHYAGSVTYTVTGLIEKNKDTLRSDVVDLLCLSRNQIVSQVFADHKESSSTRHLNRLTGRMTTLKPRTPTVAAGFQESLSTLLDKIGRCKPWFVRCLKPNTSKSAMLFNTEVIAEQVASTGLLETIRIRSLGYPYHMTCEQFLDRYEYLYRSLPPTDSGAEKFCEWVLKEEFRAVIEEDYQMGHTKLFLREAFYQHLEHQRMKVVLRAAQVIQNKVKTLLLRTRFLKQSLAATRIQAFWKAYYLRKEYLRFRRNICRCQANLRCRWQRQHFLKVRDKLAAERDQRWAEADVRKELTKEEMKAIIGLEIPADLAFLYNMTNDLPALHSERHIAPLIAKIFTQSMGLRLPGDINNYIFSNFTESHLQQHVFVAKREPINHPFLIKTREKDYKLAITLFKLVLRFMYDTHLTGQREVILGNYIIQQVLSSPVLCDELLVQICVQMWAKHQSDVSREKISLLMSLCLAVIPPSAALYKYLLKFVSDQSFNGYKLLAQHRLLRSFSSDYPTARYYPPTLLEWHATRRRIHMALPVHLPKGNIVNCHVDSWTTGEECARLALCACGLFENRHGWTVQLHDTNSVYEVGGYDCVLDLIGELEVPPGIPHAVAPFLVSTNDSSAGKHKPRYRHERAHRADINRQPSFDMSESVLSSHSGLDSTLLSIRDSLNIVPKPADSDGVDNTLLEERRTSGNISTFIANGSAAPAAPTASQHRVRAASRLNERPLTVDLPGMAKRSLLNRRYRGEASTASNTLDRSDSTTSYLSGGTETLVPSIIVDKRKGPKKLSTVTFQDQLQQPISSSDLNRRYSAGPSAAPPEAFDKNAPLNSRYLEIEGGPLLSPRSDLTNGLSFPATSVVREAPQIHQDIMVEINDEIKEGKQYSRSVAQGQPRLSRVKTGNQSRSEISDLDDWVDKVFDPIIDSVDTLSDTKAVHRSLKGNGSNASPAADAWVDSLVDKSYTGYDSLRSAQNLRQQLKGDGKTLGSATTQTGNSTEGGAVRNGKVNMLQAQLQNASLQSHLLQQSIRNGEVATQGEGSAGLATTGYVTSAAQMKDSKMNGHLGVTGDTNGKAGPAATSAEKLLLSERSVIAAAPDSAAHSSNSPSSALLALHHSSPSPSSDTPAKDSANTTPLAAISTNSETLKENSVHLVSPAVDRNPAYGKARNLPQSSAPAKTSPANPQMSVTPKRVGKVIWPPVKEEEVKQERQVGRLLIEEGSETPDPSLSHQQKRPLGVSSSAVTKKATAPAKSLTERLELLEKKIGDRPSPSDSVVQKVLSSPKQPVPPAAVVEPPSPQSSPSPLFSSPPISHAPKAALPNLPDNSVPNLLQEFVKENLQRNSTPAKSALVSERVPSRGLYQLLSSIRTTLLSDPSISEYLTYADLPWSLHIRKEVFSPMETLTNPKTEDLIFCQIVRDIFQYPCVRVPAEGAHEAKKLLGDVTVDTMTGPSVPRELKSGLVRLARSWPFYFARIFIVAAEPSSNIQLLAVGHDGVRFGRRETVTSGPAKEQLTELCHILYEDISQVKVPKPGVFHLTAEHKTYKVYSVKAGAIANLINAYGAEAMKSGEWVEAKVDCITCEPGYLSYKKGDVIKSKPDKMYSLATSLPAPRAGWVYGSFSGRLGSYSEDNVKPLTKRELSRTGSFQDTRSRHSSGMSEGEPSQYTGKYSMLEFSMMYFRENLDRYSTRPNEMGIQSNIKLIENSKLPGVKRKKSFTKQKDADKLQRQESWSWKEQADMIKWTKTPIVSSLLKLPTEPMNRIAVECFYSIQLFMGDQPHDASETDEDCVFRILKASHQCSELRDEIYCQLARQTTNNKSPNSQSCLKGWRLFTLLACWFSPSDILKPFLVNYIQQNASDPSRPYHASAHNCLQMLRKTMKFRGRRNVPSLEEITDIARGKLIKRQAILLPGGIPFYSNISPSTVVQDIIDEICSKLGVVSQMEQDEYTVFAMVEADNEYSRLKREEYVMDVVTELRLQGKECALIFERTSWYFPLRVESATYEYLDMMFMQSIPDYIDGYLLTLDHNSTIPPRQLDDIVSVAALLYRSAGYEDEPESLKEVESYFPGPVLSLGLMRHQQFLDGVNKKLARLTNFTSEDCKVEALNMLKKWPLFGASFFSIQCLTEPKVTGDCLLAVNRAGIHFLHHKTHKVILSYPFTDIISSRKISSDKISDTQYLDIKVGNNMVQKVVRIETMQGPDIAHLIGQYVRAVNSSAKLST